MNDVGKLLVSIVAALLVVIIFSALSRALIRWQASRLANRMIDEGLYPERYLTRTPPKLDPESKFIIHLSEEAVSCQRPDGQIERVEWKDLQRVEILTNSDGPFLPDIFWILSGTNSGCVIPWGATGDEELLQRLQQLPGFDSTAILNAAPKMEEAMTVCWQKPHLT